jgi:hypothetical protein
LRKDATKVAALIDTSLRCSGGAAGARPRRRIRFARALSASLRLARRRAQQCLLQVLDAFGKPWPFAGEGRLHAAQGLRSLAAARGREILIAPAAMTQKAPASPRAFFLQPLHAASAIDRGRKSRPGCHASNSAAHSKGRQRSCERQRCAYGDRERRAGLPRGLGLASSERGFCFRSPSIRARNRPISFRIPWRISPGGRSRAVASSFAAITSSSSSSLGRSASIDPVDRAKIAG